ncbi:MAG: dTMP kinase [Acidobacteriota bacterium]|nr:dTMP kinase [Bryobacteraceae bacterium]
MSTTDARRRGAGPRPAGLFVNFEGGDGCGKTTQMHILARRLAAEGRDVLETTEPGGTRIGTMIRRILLDSANQELCPTAELLLYFASRAQNVEEVIIPALKQGKIVLSDRFTDSTMAYQGFGRGLGEQIVVDLDRIACRGLAPDLTILIDIDLETSLARAKQRNLDLIESRMDAQAVEFHQKVRDAYLELARREPVRFRVIDGRGAIDTVACAVWKAVEQYV